MVLKAKIFKFTGYKIDYKNLKIVFNYEIEFYNREPLCFSETIILPKKTTKLKDKNIHNILKPLALILGVGYYKIYFPPKIEMFFKVSREEADFWNVVYRKGLGENLYRNKLDPDKLAKFPYTKKQNKPFRTTTNDNILLGIGGGKDSIVAMSLLKKFKTSLFLVETMRPDPISQNVIKKSGKPSLIIERKLDQKLIEIKDGYNGHIPISTVFSFLGILSCFLYEYKYFVVGNEYSSNFGNIKYKGETINHQWSKSAEFESMVQEYTRKFITPDITYFSLLRQFHEIRITEMFVKEKEYFQIFSSCNRNFKAFGARQNKLWCGECPKCAFVFLMFSSFLKKNQLLQIFGKNLLNDESLLSLYEDLLGFGKLKPFDCVGTFEESRVAMSMSSKRGFDQDYIVKALSSKVIDIKNITKKVFKVYNAPTLPTQFKLLGLKNICILGYGKEGKVTEGYLKREYPDLKIGILDKSLDKNYLEKQKNYDFAIKTPGIPKREVIIPYTTATNLFFAENKNFTIGITGSKGKSTTATLVYKILKTSGKKVQLLGNIGNPMLESLLVKQRKGEIYVIELSSYMLEDIEYSPNIAVLLNLFPEHMDYHEGLENYYKAKNNIFKFQKSGDIALHPPFNVKIPLQSKQIPLIGKHNLENIKAAIKIVKTFGVSDEKIRKTILSFKGLPHRLEYVGKFKDIKFYDDAISTAPESTIQALTALPETATIFLGGEDRGYDFRELEKVLRHSKVKNIVLFPDSGKRILKSKKGFKVLKTSSMAKAVDFAFANTPREKICLLSTASPSYSLWKNFEEKGNLFKSLVVKYAKK